MHTSFSNGWTILIGGIVIYFILKVEAFSFWTPFSPISQDEILGKSTFANWMVSILKRDTIHHYSISALVYQSPARIPSTHCTCDILIFSVDLLETNRWTLCSHTHLPLPGPKTQVWVKALELATWTFKKSEEGDVTMWISMAAWFIFTSIWVSGEMNPFDEHIFHMGWKHQLAVFGRQECRGQNELTEGITRKTTGRFIGSLKSSWWVLMIIAYIPS